MENTYNYIINNFENIKLNFDWKSDRILEKKTYELCKNIFNFLLNEVGIIIENSLIKKYEGIRYYSINLKYKYKEFIEIIPCVIKKY
jgi:hypothetical protein